MKQILFLSIFVLGFSFSGATQPPLYDDLLIYFADGEYEKVVDKAEKYIAGEDTKNDALPYLYSAKANYEMSKDQKYKEDFPKAFNDAIGNAGKAVKKDKEGWGGKIVAIGHPIKNIWFNPSEVLQKMAEENRK